MKVTLIGIDLAKNILQVCGVNQGCKVVFNRQIKREKLFEFLCQHPDAVIAMEACSGSNYWGRELELRGYTVKLIPPQHVKPFVKGNKNDRNDAFAICEATNRPRMQFVSPRSLAQTDAMLVHKIIDRLIRERNALINQTRGLMNEYGIIVPKGREKLRSELPFILEDAENGLTDIARRFLQLQLREWQSLDQSIAELEKEIRHQSNTNEQAKRLMAIKGVGERISTAMVACLGNGSQYKNGRHFSANLGLVPKEHSSGGKQKLGSITKRGNRYLRRLLIQGAWSVVRYSDKSDDRLSRWTQKVIARCGKHKAAVAVANKLARIIWAMSYYQSEYKAY